MKLTTISGIVGTLMLCMIAVLILFQQIPEVKDAVSIISVLVVMVEGVILLTYSFYGD
jgi:uncharacterized membrane protein YccC